MKKLIIIVNIYAILNLSCESQDYEKVYYQDTTYVKYDIVENYELGYDTLYYIKYPYSFENKWKVFYDKAEDHVLLESSYSNDTCTMKQYYINGKKKRVYFYLKNGQLLRDIAWYPNSQLMCDIDYRNNKSKILIVKYYPNGTKRLEYINDSGFIVGEYKEWYNNTELKSIGTFDDNNRKDSIWKYYNENGELEKTEEYENGELIKIEQP
ncbi:MAG: hypothetical protein K8R68_04350 [Bacteroidales bacterium]|nr:hypothetical protein [Bacteroidales bacterium]